MPHKIIKNRVEYRNYPTAFFIDRDFDKLQNHADIYETPCYSIENLYCNIDCFAAILKSEFSLTEIDEDFKTAKTHFTSRLNEFNQAVLLLNAWYACAKDARLNSILPINIPKLGNKIPDNFVEITFDKITFNYNLANIETDIDEKWQKGNKEGNVFKVDNQKFMQKVAAFEAENNKTCVFRGKYQLLFFAFYLHHLAENGNQKTPTFFKEKRKNHLTISKDNSEKILSSYSQYANTPDCLRDYLQKF